LIPSSVDKAAVPVAYAARRNTSESFHAARIADANSAYPTGRIRDLYGLLSALLGITCRKSENLNTRR
jgi:hypothetical protein